MQKDTVRQKHNLAGLIATGEVQHGRAGKHQKKGTRPKDKQRLKNQLNRGEWE